MHNTYFHLFCLCVSFWKKNKRFLNGYTNEKTCFNRSPTIQFDLFPIQMYHAFFAWPACGEYSLCMNSHTGSTAALGLELHV
jgi:hypothetical protein